MRAGGGSNHRFGLSDAIMVKDNHLVALGATDGSALTDALRSLRARAGHTTSIIVVDPQGRAVAALPAPHQPAVMLRQFDALRAFLTR